MSQSRPERRDSRFIDLTREAVSRMVSVCLGILAAAFDSGEN